MNISVIIHGRQPALGRIELESLYSKNSVSSIGKEASLLNLSPDDVQFSRLGGAVKLGKVLAKIPSVSWQDIEKYLQHNIPDHLDNLDEGKLRIGLSVYGFNISPQKINATALSIKKTIKNHGKSVRVVPNNETSLSSAQVIHNKLTKTNGWEFLIIKDTNKTILALSEDVQDISAYAARDQARPKRDAKVGMLPPKLAQIMINLAVSDKDPSTILDPFCGTGVVLQEALLMGYSVYGSDLDPRMIDYTDANLTWLGSNFKDTRLEQADATSHIWNRVFDTIVSETYLGRPLAQEPDREILQKIIQDTDTIHKKFLLNLRPQITAGTRICLAVPAWKTKTGFKHLPTIDKLKEMGYTRLSFAHAKGDELIYHREGQFVGRELVVLTKD